MNMRVERVSVDKVKAKLDELKAKMEATASKPEEYLPDGWVGMRQWFNYVGLHAGSLHVFCLFTSPPCH